MVIPEAPALPISGTLMEFACTVRANSVLDSTMVALFNMVIIIPYAFKDILTKSLQISLISELKKIEIIIG